MNIDLNNFINGLKIDEWQHVDLSSKFIEYANYYHTHKNPIFIDMEWGRITSLISGKLWINYNISNQYDGIYITNNGIIFPAFSNDFLENCKTDILHMLFDKLKIDIKVAIGMHWQISLIEKIYKRISQRSINYRLLTLEKKMNYHTQQKKSFFIRKASIQDLDLLWPLEKSYLIEEVIENNSTVNDGIARNLLSDILKKQIVYCAILRNSPIAKGNTNARGWLYDQIGGVFVNPEYRNRGIGRFLMQHLILDIFSKQRFCCLYVKESNAPALHLYQSLGFTDRGKYRISYWDE